MFQIVRTRDTYDLKYLPGGLVEETGGGAVEEER